VGGGRGAGGRLGWARPLLLLLLLAASACQRTAETTPNGSALLRPWGEAPIAFVLADAAVFRGDSPLAGRLRLEVAETPRQHERGLMHRTALPVDAGMLFLLPSPMPAEAGFWMKNTRVPLDIAYLDAGGRIVALRSMEPCRARGARCPLYPPGHAYHHAVEVSRGWFAERGVGVGGRVAWRVRPTSTRESEP
jgi:uncharacterized membrane protein (UPF0127 family)